MTNEDKASYYELSALLQRQAELFEGIADKDPEAATGDAMTSMNAFLLGTLGKQVNELSDYAIISMTIAAELIADAQPERARLIRKMITRAEGIRKTWEDMSGALEEYRQQRSEEPPTT